MPGPAGILLALIVATQSPLELGKAAMDAHDPAAAIAHFGNADSREGRAWLAVALMMESRAPSDPYIERAFDAAARSRSNNPAGVRSRAELAAALRPGEMVVTYLFVEQHAYGWAFDRDAMIGYPLPRPREIAAAVEHLRAYLAADDRAGVERVAGELVPALLGPVLDRTSAPTRLVVVPHGPIGELPLDRLLDAFGLDLPVSTAADAALLEEIKRPPSPRRTPRSIAVRAGAVAAAVLWFVMLSRRARRRSRARS
jgi:hypothetical protein